MNQPDPVPYMAEVFNNLSGMLRETTKNRDGTPKNLPSDVAAAVLIAQSNLAIASALRLVAQAIEEHS